MRLADEMRAAVAIRVGGWCGVAGPLGFTLAWLLLGATRAGYDPRNQYISELAASDAPRWWAMVAAFIMLGVLMLIFARGLLRALGTGATALGVIALLSIFGGTSVVSGLARCDPGCGGSSPMNALHTISTHLGLGALVLATLLLPWAVWPDRRWRTFRPYSWLTGIAAAAIFLRGFEKFGGVGLGQRLFVCVLFLWLVVVATRILRMRNTG